LDGAEKFSRPVEQSPFGDFYDEVHSTSGTFQKPGGGIGREYRRFEIDEEPESGRQTVGDGIVDGGSSAGVVKLRKPSLVCGSAESPIRRDVQVRPPGQSLDGDLLAGSQVIDRLIDGLEIAAVEQSVKIDRLNIGHRMPLPWEKVYWQPTPSL
jgi:hypothetical protein